MNSLAWAIQLEQQPKIADSHFQILMLESDTEFFM